MCIMDVHVLNLCMYSVCVCTCCIFHLVHVWEREKGGFCTVVHVDVSRVQTPAIKLTLFLAASYEPPILATHLSSVTPRPAPAANERRPRTLIMTRMRSPYFHLNDHRRPSFTWRQQQTSGCVLAVTGADGVADIFFKICFPFCRVSFWDAVTVCDIRAALTRIKTLSLPPG